MKPDITGTEIMSEFIWQFPRNDSDETEGPNDGGISHFTSDRMANVIRECIQNSLDARDDQSRPVKVEIDLTTLSSESFAAKSLERSLLAAVESPHNDAPHKRQFEQGAEFLNQARAGVKTLKITDSNTTGADDNLRMDGAPSKWESLTKSTGLSVKDQPDAAGSFGLGKHAPFAATDIRTVLYSTTWKTGDGQLHRRFQGKAILVSHQGEAGEKYRKTGYLGDNYAALTDNNVPADFRLNEPGLAIYIPGYESDADWEQESRKTVIDHFFHAIIHGGLEAEIAGNLVSKEKINQYEVSPRTADFIRVSQAPPVAETNIPDIGHVVLRLQATDNRRRIALVRDAGMMITDVPREMKIPGTVRLPSHWRIFTAIIECRSEGQPSVLRESESPSHTSISTQQISDRNRRNRANAALKELGSWCREQIRLLVEPAPSEDIVNAAGIARYLSIEDKEGDQPGIQEGRNRGKGIGEVEVTVPQQTNRPPPGNYAGQGRRVATQGRGGGDDSDTGGRGKKGGKGQRRRGSVTRNLPVAFARMRFRPGTRRPTHSLMVTFDNPSATLRNIQLMAAVEDGTDVQIGISEAYASGRKLSVKHNKIASLPPGASDRRSIEFITQVPVENKTYYLLQGGE